MFQKQLARAKKNRGTDMYYIGIDGGGTKTSLKIFDEQKHCIASVLKPTCHLLQVSPKQAIQVLTEGVKELLKKIPSEENILIGVGLAGYGEDKILRDKIEKVCQQAFSSYEYYIFNDVSIALEGALNGKDGILVVAGTGSIALSKKNKKYTRTGGWGYMLGDEGSAYWIAKEIFRHYTLQIDGRSERTQLVHIVKDKLGLEKEYDLISYVANKLKNDRREIANHAIILQELILIKDPVAFEILDALAGQLSLLINTLGKNFRTNITVSYIGGVFNLGDELFKRLRSNLSTHIHLVEPKYSPEIGAVIKAKNIKTKGGGK